MEKTLQYNKSAYYLKVVMFGLIVGATMQLAYAWVAPTAPPPSGNIGLRQYVSDCNQFAANGWSSKNECLTDGRWHMVQNTAGFANADLRAAIYAGVEVRITHTNAVITGATCTQTLIFDNYAYCNGAPHYGGSVRNGTPDSTYYGFNASSPRPHQTWGHLGAAIYRSDGRYKATKIVPASDGSVSTARVGQATGSVSGLSWYIRY